MDILKFPDPILFEVMPPVTVFGEELRVLLDSMWGVMQESRGIGLAGNQVGLRLRMFVMNGPEGRMDLINPIIISKSRVPANLKEGCLSAPGDFVVVPSRSDWVQIRYQNEFGEQKLALLKGLHAVCAAHEIEHLDGQTFMANKSLPKKIRKILAKKWSL